MCCREAVEEVHEVLTQRYARYTHKRDLVNTLVSFTTLANYFFSQRIIFKSILAFNPEDQDLLARNLARQTTGISKGVMDSPCTDCLGGRSMGQVMNEFNNKHKQKNQNGQQSGGGRGGRGGGQGRGKRGRDNQGNGSNDNQGNGNGRRGRNRNQNDRGGRGQNQNQNQGRDNNKNGSSGKSEFQNLYQ